jgi:hypothetical protein
MTTDNLMGATVRIRRGWHGGRTGEVVTFDHQVGKPYSHTAIKVKLKGSGQLVMIYSLDELEALPDPQGVAALSSPPELSEVV